MNTNLADLNRALADNELVPYFQPIVELRTGRLSGFEVLARWDHPTHGAVLPSNLIELAEGNGLIGEVARQVFTKAFKLIGAVPEILKLSVNLSPVQLGDDGLTRQIEEMAAGSNFPLDRLTIEITESALLSDLLRAQEVANELKELGCCLSLDDFGTGYSSLAHLNSLPFDELKIDRSFVSKMSNKRESRKIVAAIIGLGHSLGLRTVAEGIETEEQADMLLWLGSELGQGWHYGKPAPFQAIREQVTAPPRPAAAGMLTPGDDWAVSSLEAFPTQRLAQLQAIYDGAPVGLCFLDTKLRYLSVNQKLADMNGATVAAHLGNTVRNMVPDLYPSVESYLSRALGGEAIAGVEVPRRMQDPETIRWNLISYQPAFDEADEVIGVSISVLDITERKVAEDQLREREFVHLQFAELNRQVPWTMDPAGKSLQTGSIRSKALSSDKLSTRNLGWLEAVHVDDLKATIRKMKKCLRTGEKIDMEYRVQNPEGEWRWMRSRGLPRFGPNGEITRWYGSVEDIHDQRCAKAEAHKTEAAMRALLKAVPVAVIIEEGKKRAFFLSEAPPSEEPAHLPPTPELGDVEGTVARNSTPPDAKIQDHIFQERNLESALLSRSVSSKPKKKKASADIGLRIVSDLHHASEERQRLVTMLEEFADYRTKFQPNPAKPRTNQPLTDTPAKVTSTRPVTAWPNTVAG